MSNATPPIRVPLHLIALQPRRPRLAASHLCPRSRYKITVALGTRIKGVKATDAAEPKKRHTAQAMQERFARKESQIRLFRAYARISRAYLESVLRRASKGPPINRVVDLAMALPALQSARRGRKRYRPRPVTFSRDNNSREGHYVLRCTINGPARLSCIFTPTIACASPLGTGAFMLHPATNLAGTLNIWHAL